MILTNQVNELERRVQTLVRSGKQDRVRAITAFRARWHRVSKQIEQLPETVNEATFDVMYSELEEVLMAFELFASRRKPTMPQKRQARQSSRWN